VDRRASAYYISYYILRVVVCMWVCGGCSLFITILLYYRDKCHPRKSEEKNALETILSDKTLCDLFADFSKHEFSLENLYFKQAIIDYKNSPIDERTILVKSIRAKFLTPNSAFEVNLPSQVIEDISVATEKLVFPNDLFFDCEHEVTRNLQDTFHRFQFSADYLAHRSKLQLLGVEGK
jgi:hypothetical protein